MTQTAENNSPVRFLLDTSSMPRRIIRTVKSTVESTVQYEASPNSKWIGLCVVFIVFLALCFCAIYCLDMEGGCILRGTVEDIVRSVKNYMRSRSPLDEENISDTVFSSRLQHPFNGSYSSLPPSYEDVMKSTLLDLPPPYKEASKRHHCREKARSNNENTACIPSA